MRTNAAFFAISWLALTACSSSKSATDSSSVSGPSTAADASAVTCQGDPRVDAFTANMTKSSVDGALKITIVSGDPAPPTIGTNTWVVKMTDAQGAPITTVPKIEPFMPDHNHGTSIKAGATLQPDGTFNVTPLYLFMPGVWRVTFSVPSSAESVAFFFCVSD